MCVYYVVTSSQINVNKITTTIIQNLTNMYNSTGNLMDIIHNLLK